jgi:hypothetical protein
MFGIGPAELLVLLVLGFLVFGFPIAIVILLVVLLRNRNADSTSPSYAQLLEENQRLRNELAEARSKNT